MDISDHVDAQRVIALIFTSFIHIILLPVYLRIEMYKL